MAAEAPGSIYLATAVIATLTNSVPFRSDSEKGRFCDDVHAPFGCHHIANAAGTAAPPGYQWTSYEPRDDECDCYSSRTDLGETQKPARHRTALVLAAWRTGDEALSASKRLLSTTSNWIADTPVCSMPNAFAAAYDRSRIRPFEVSTRSLMRIMTWVPLTTLTMRATVPNVKGAMSRRERIHIEELTTRSHIAVEIVAIP